MESFIDGKDLTILAYGATGSGKTHTIQGRSEESERGLLWRSVSFILEHLEKKSNMELSFKLEFAAVELYCDNLTDLLDLKNGELKIVKTKLKVNI